MKKKFDFNDKITHYFEHLPTAMLKTLYTL